MKTRDSNLKFFAKLIVVLLACGLYGGVFFPALQHDGFFAILAFFFGLLVLVFVCIRWLDNGDDSFFDIEPPASDPGPRYGLVDDARTALEDARKSLSDPDVPLGMSAGDPALHDGPNAPGTVESTPRGPRHW